MFLFYLIFFSLVKSLAWYYFLGFSQFICNLHLFAFGFNCQVVRLKPRDTIILLAAKCGQNYLLIFYVFKICALCDRCLRTPNIWLEIMVIIEFVSCPCNSMGMKYSFLDFEFFNLWWFFQIHQFSILKTILDLVHKNLVNWHKRHGSGSFYMVVRLS